MERRKAVALEYRPDRDQAPRVTASGAGALAERIIDLARQNGIPLREDPALVEVLSRLDLHEEIPLTVYGGGGRDPGLRLPAGAGAGRPGGHGRSPSIKEKASGGPSRPRTTGSPRRGAARLRCSSCLPFPLFPRQMKDVDALVPILKMEVFTTPFSRSCPQLPCYRPFCPRHPPCTRGRARLPGIVEADRLQTGIPEGALPHPIPLPIPPQGVTYPRSYP